MRHGARCVGLALALLALAVAGCDLVSSVTPFGLGTRGADESRGTYSGAWSGATSAAGTATFTVRSGEVIDLVLTHTLSCGLTLEFTFTDPIPVEGDQFSTTMNLDPQGRIFLSARFTSPDSVAGDYSFNSMPSTANCDNFGRGTFTAQKVPSNP